MLNKNLKKLEIMYGVAYTLADGTEYGDKYISILEAVAAYNSVEGAAIRILNMFVYRECYTLETEIL